MDFILFNEHNQEYLSQQYREDKLIFVGATSRRNEEKIPMNTSNTLGI